MNDTKTKILYTVKEVAKIMHTNPAYVYSLIHAGLLPALQLGSYKIRHETLIKFLAVHEGEDLRDPNNIRPICKTVDPDHHEQGDIFTDKDGRVIAIPYR